MFPDTSVPFQRKEVVFCFKCKKKLGFPGFSLPINLILKRALTMS